MKAGQRKQLLERCSNGSIQIIVVNMTGYIQKAPKKTLIKFKISRVKGGFAYNRVTQLHIYKNKDEK